MSSARAEVLRDVLPDVGARRLLEVDVRVLRRERRRDVAVRRREDQLVALRGETRNRLRELRADRNVLLIGRLHLRPERLLDVLPSGLVRLRPAAVVVRADVDPGHLERRRGSCATRAASGEHQRDHARQKHRRDDHAPVCLHLPSLLRHAIVWARRARSRCFSRAVRGCHGASFPNPPAQANDPATGGPGHRWTP